MADFLQRLKQHHIYRIAAWYGASIAVLIQIVARAFPYFDWSAAVPAVIIILIAGFPVAIVLAWLLVKPVDIASQSAWQRRHWKLGAMVVPVVIAAVVVSGICAFHYAERHEAYAAAVPASISTLAPSPATVIPAKSVAVLPFENLSADKNNAYFADGMQDLILTKLAGIGDLKVIARTSTMQYGSHPKNLMEIARQLGVATILEGSVQKAGNQVLINVQLIDANTDAHLWASDYQRTLDNIFGVEGEVAQKIAQALDAKLTLTESQAVASIPTKNPQAYTLYLKALHEIDQGLSGGFNDKRFEVAATYLQQAIQFDPNFALAYAELARVQANMVLDGYEDTKALRKNVLVNAQKALALQPDLVEGHASLAGAYLLDGRTDQAVQQLQTAVRLSPNAAAVHLLLFFVYSSRSQWESAGASIAQAMRLDPHYTPVYFFSAQLDEALWRYAAAGQTLQQGLTILPDNQTLQLGQANLLLLQGRPDDALVVLAKLALTTDRNAATWQAYMLLRQFEQARDAAGKLYIRPNYANAGLRPLQVAVAEIALGNSSAAQAALNQARDQVQGALRQHPKESYLYDTLARIEMWSGNREQALHSVSKAWSLAPQSFGFIWSRFGFLETKAEVLAHFGDTAGAVALLDQLLATEGAGLVISPGLLRLNPVWDPIRHDSRFQALLKKYEDAGPNTSAAAASVNQI